MPDPSFLAQKIREKKARGEFKKKIVRLSGYEVKTIKPKRQPKLTRRDTHEQYLAKHEWARVAYAHFISGPKVTAVLAQRFVSASGLFISPHAVEIAARDFCWRDRRTELYAQADRMRLEGYNAALKAMQPEKPAAVPPPPTVERQVQTADYRLYSAKRMKLRKRFDTEENLVELDKLTRLIDRLGKLMEAERKKVQAKGPVVHPSNQPVVPAADEESERLRRIAELDSSPLRVLDQSAPVADGPVYREKFPVWGDGKQDDVAS